MNKQNVIIAHFSMKDDKDLENGLDALLKYIVERDKTDEIQVQIFGQKNNSSSNAFDKIVQNFEKLGFKWNSMINDTINNRCKDIYKIKVRIETSEDNSKKSWLKLKK